MTRKTRRTTTTIGLAAGLALAALAGPALAEMSVALGGGWDGKRIPAGQQCTLYGGKGGTPPMRVSGVPAAAKWIVVEYNDSNYQPLSTKGGHGTLAYPVRGATTDLPPVPGMTAKLPGGVQVMRPARSSGKFASKGYLPPCSGGRGNLYVADLMAVDAQGKVLDRARVRLGKY